MLVFIIQMPANLCNTFCEQIIKLFVEKYKIPIFAFKKGFYISKLFYCIISI